MLVDKEQALEMQNGDKEFLLEIWKLFVEDSTSKVGKFEEAMDDNDFEKVERLAHSLKSSSAVIGSSILSKQAAELEQTASSGSEDEVKKVYADFRETLSGVLDVLKKEVGQS